MSNGVPKNSENEMCPDGGCDDCRPHHFGSDSEAESFEEVCSDCGMSGLDLNKHGACEVCASEAAYDRHVDAQIDTDRDGNWE